MEMLAELLDLIPQWLQALTVLVTGANGVTMLTPSTADNRAVNWLMKLLNLLSMNIGKNRNKDA